MGKKVEHKITWKVLKIFARECSSDDHWQGQFCFLVFVWEEFIELVKDFGAKVNT